MSLEQKIFAWFKETWGGGLILPNGWFGKPYDNTHQLESIIENNSGLIIVLDGGHLTLNFEGVPKIKITKSELIFCSFHRLVFDWNEYGSIKVHSEVYERGEVKIVAPPGG